MTWECQWNHCGLTTETLLEMCEHQISKHKDRPPETGIICIEHITEQKTLLDKELLV